MNVELKKLISQADCGDSNAQKQLMDLAQEKSDTGKDKEAAELFKIAAIAYRIAASRNGTLAEEAESKYLWLNFIVKLYQEWIAGYTKPVSPRIKRLRNINLECLESTILDMIQNGDKYQTMLLGYLQDKLMNHGIHFSAPGGTIDWHFLCLIQEREDYRDFVHDTEMRVVLDPLSDILANFCPKAKRSKSNELDKILSTYSDKERSIK